MLMDPQQTDSTEAIQLQQEVNMPKARFKPTPPEKYEGVWGVAMFARRNTERLTVQPF